jgi:membrane-associated phospholipid phosphatase
MLRDVLPIVRPDSVDAQLYALDLQVFGFEPALWLERYNQRHIVEWFSFFYYSYFWIDLFYLVTVIWLMKPSRLTTTFAIGTVIVFCGGQLGYMAVPGYGPISFLADKYHAPVNGGFFWGLVWETYAAGSAMKDIFPSLHTAIPVWFTFFAFHAAKTDRRWRWAAWITAFFAANIIVSTMLLRWHYAIDVVAGLAFSTATGLLAPRIAAWEEARRASRGLSGPWELEATPPSLAR